MQQAGYRGREITARQADCGTFTIGEQARAGENVFVASCANPPSQVGFGDVFQVNITVQNDSTQPVTADLTVFVDGTTFTTQSVNVVDGGSSSAMVEIDTGQLDLSTGEHSISAEVTNVTVFDPESLIP